MSRAQLQHNPIGVLPAQSTARFVAISSSFVPDLVSMMFPGLRSRCRRIDEFSGRRKLGAKTKPFASMYPRSGLSFVESHRAGLATCKSGLFGVSALFGGDCTKLAQQPIRFIVRASRKEQLVRRP